MSRRKGSAGLLVGRWARWEGNLRRALLDTMLPSPSDRLPSLESLALDDFWGTMAATAPLHLRVAMPAASLLLGVLLPLGLGYRRTLAGLSLQQREAVLERASRLPLAADLVDVVKIVACLAYFDAPEVQRAVRGAASPTRTRPARPTAEVAP